MSLKLTAVFKQRSSRADSVPSALPYFRHVVQAARLPHVPLRIARVVAA